MQELIEWRLPDFSAAAFEIVASKVPLRMAGVVVHVNVVVVTDRWLEPESGDLILVAGQVAAARCAANDCINVVALEGHEIQVRQEAARVVVGLLCPTAFPRPPFSAVEGLPERISGELVTEDFGGERVASGRSNGGGSFPMRVSQGNTVGSLSCQGSDDE